MISHITDYGAQPGTDVLQTSLIQAAIDKCAEAGGGKVIIPSGLFRTGTLELKSNVTLYLENGAVLKGPDRIEDYRELPFAWELYPYTLPLIYAEHAKNIRIEGAGTIDFNGRAFAIRTKLCAAENTPEEFRNEAHFDMPPRDKRPNRLVFFKECEDVEITGVTFADSPTWTLVFHRSRFLRLHDFRVKNDLQIPNNDGIHCCGCKDVLISGCFFNCGDDCIALTSISDSSAVNERVLISDCIFQSRSAALRVGFQEGKVRNVKVRNCIIHDSNRGIAVFAGKEGFVEDVDIDGITIETHLHAGYWWGKGEPLVICSSDAASPICNITLRNAMIRSENGIILSCVNHSASQIRFENVKMTLSYGKHRPWMGAKIDLAPNPGKEALDPKTHIPSVWSDGGAEYFTEKFDITRAVGETVLFEIKEFIQK